MRSLLQAGMLLSASVSALYIPSSHHSRQVTHQENAVAGSSAAGGVAVLFSVPCPGCFADADDELDLEIKLDSTSLACQSSAIVLNDVRLSPYPGPIVFNTIASPMREVQASWQMSCLDAQVTLLSVWITSPANSAQVQPNLGFAISFKQSQAPEILRLEQAPVSNTDDFAALQKWTQPQGSPEYVVIPASVAIDDKLPNELQHQLRRLHEIKAHIARLHYKYMRQEHRVFEMIKQDFRACDGATCLLQTAIKKAPEMFELLKAHFKHRPEWSKLHDHKPPFWDVPEGIQKQGDAAIMYGGHKPPHDEEFSHASGVMPEHTPFPTTFDEPKPDDSHPHLMDDDHIPPPPPVPDHERPERPPGHHVRPHHEHGDRPPWAGHHRPGHPRPHFFGRHGPHRHPFYFSIGSILLFIVVASLLFRCVRSKTSRFRNNRRKRDCAAKREECRNRAAYKRAAMRHRWRRWWSQFRQPESTSGYEEKRNRILGQEEALEDIMQSDINELRRAHELVGEMMRAEENRQRMHYEANFGNSPQAASSFEAPVRQNTDSSQETESVLPLYQPPPPSYDQELEGEMMVVDGFLYTPSATDSTADSSVIDCSSVMSFDTGMNVTKE